MVIVPARDWRGDVLGYIVALHACEPTTEKVGVVLEAAAVAAAVALSEQQSVERTRLELDGDFFERLLSPEEQSVDDLLARAKALGVELSEFYWPCLIDCGDSPQPPSSWVTRVRRYVVGELGPVHAGMDNGALYLLVPDSGIGVQKRHVISVVLSRLLATVEGHAKQPPFALLARHSVGLVHVGREWRELILTRNVVRVLGGADGVHTVDEFVLPHLLVDGIEKGHAARFVDKVIGPVLEYDRINHTRLLWTLEAYLDSGCSQSKTARVTNYHRNTVVRQLERLQQILGSSLDDAIVRLSLHLAIKIHRLS
ncbi:MAG: helix-turn-helix domain-containing protein [Chloroflexi bacterium]|nr:helix-turn-helix domain-containing protein [Chloroflexota bacterium]